jgi:DNA-binding transcriptional regulator YhcF (GntR family)
MSGYVRIHRTLLGHPAFRNDAEAMAFAWMVAKAAWRQTRVRYKGHAISLNRGQLSVSVRDMAAALDRDKAWVERLWKRLKAESMIETVVETKVTVVTIRKYDEYQADNDIGETPRKTSRETVNETPARQSRDTEQEEKKGSKSSEDKSSGQSPAIDPVKSLFDLGVAILTDASIPEKEARSLVGKWRKQKTDAEVLTALLECRAKAISEPVEWLTKRLKSAKYVSATGYEYRGSIDDVIRESERRADWNIHWAAKTERDGSRKAASG